MDWRRRRLLQIAALLVLPSPAAAAPIAAADAPVFAVETVTVVTASGRHRFRAEIADTPEKWSRGLQHRPTLDADAAMLFVFDAPRVATMWMKDTPVALDMLFLAADGRIVGVAENTAPLSLATIRAPGPVRGVLEVAAGTARRLGFTVGDRVEARFVASQRQ